ncbi:MAG: sulfatase-like hydrolase/transferase [Clostridia bacterium]
MKQPNILILFTDDQRFDTIHALGNDEIITPNIDKLVENGTTFTHAHIPGGTSGAVCMPSRAMLNTGRTLFAIKGQGQEIDDSHKLMGEYFKENGYDTFGTGKWHNGSKAYARSFTDGDNIFFGGMNDHWCVPVHSFDPDGNYHGRVKKICDFNYKNKPEVYKADKINVGQHSTEFLTEGLLKFLDKDHSEKPFYAYTAFLAPHDPRTMPDEFREMYNPEEITIPKNFQDYHHIEYANVQCRDELLAPYPRTEENTKFQIAEYYAMISHIDYQIGRVLDKLEEKGLKDNTIIVLAGDNGLALGQHGLFGKQSLYDHSVRVPLILSGTGIDKGCKKDSLVYLSDIFPTLCDVLGYEIPESVNSVSFANVLKNEAPTSREHLYLVYTDKIRGITKDGFKYIEHRFNGKHTHSFFDLNNDPNEMANLYEHAAYQEKIAQMQALMKEEAMKSGEMEQDMGQTYWNQ